VLRAWLASTELPAAALPAILANYTATGYTEASYTEGRPDGALRLRLAAESAERLARDLWHQDPVPLLAAVRAPVLVLAARQGDPRQDLPRRESIRKVRAMLGTLASVRWVAGGHDLPLQCPDQVARALTALASRAPDPA
jgi:pimeloyl-ACP methyl ester carboxylesterase